MSLGKIQAKYNKYSALGTLYGIWFYQLINIVWYDLSIDRYYANDLFSILYGL